MKTNYLFLVASLFCVMTATATPTNGLQFSGASTSYIDCGVNSDYSPAQFTIEVWAYYESTSGGYIISNEGYDNSNSTSHGFALRTSGSKIEISLGTGSGWDQLQSITNISLNTWMHIAVTYSGSELKLYVNGVEDATKTVTSPMAASNYNLCIGEGSMWKDRRFTGKMSDLRFWNVVRSQADISASMSSSLSGTETGLVANWKMNEGTGSTVADATGNHTVTKPDAVNWFDLSNSVPNTHSDMIKATIVGRTLNISNNLDSKINICLYNLTGQKVIERTINASSLFEEQLNNPAGVYILKCIAEDGSIHSEKFTIK
jgi:hypothetical protein